MYQPNSEIVESSSMQNRMSTLNPGYFKSIFCIIKFLLIVTLFCGCFSASFTYSYFLETKYYNFVAIIGIIYQFVFILLNLFKCPERFPNVPFMFIEIGNDFLWGTLILVASAIASDYVRRFSVMETYAAAAGFGYFAVVLYLIDGIYRITQVISIKAKSYAQQSTRSSGAKYQAQMFS